MTKRRGKGAKGHRGRRRGRQHPDATPRKSKRASRRRIDLLLVAITVVAVAATAYFLATLPSDDENNPPPSNGDWLASYSPTNRLGTAEADWWTVLPDINPGAGQDVVHPAWVTDMLEDGPLIILTHSTGCAPCIEQGDDVRMVMDAHGSRITYLDLLSDGSDQRAYDTFAAYDANGDPNYIPLTIVLTKMRTSEGTRIVWHATVGATGVGWIESYVKDAIYYHGKD